MKWVLVQKAVKSHLWKYKEFVPVMEFGPNRNEPYFLRLAVFLSHRCPWFLL